MTGNFPPERVAGIPRNGWQVWRGILKIALPCMPLGGNQGFEVQIGHDIRVTVYSGSDLELVAHVIAAIRSVS
jgi:hypothetical protein